MIDCFMFFNELDLLEIRLNSLAPYVDRFVLSECTITHSGQPKPLYFQENKERFKDFNITHIIADGAEKFIGFPWAIENYQREVLLSGIRDEPPESLILISDLDEIPDLDSYEPDTEGFFRHRLYYYYLNLYSGDNDWRGTLVVQKYKISVINRFRDRREINAIALQNGRGWHFSTLGPKDNIITKIESFAHQEFNTTEIKAEIENRVKTFLEPYDRDKIPLRIEMPSGPKWLLNNTHRYPHLFYSA
jgi:hypothetical protein